MKIHSPSPHKQVPSKCNDYFFNYFTLGVVRKRSRACVCKSWCRVCAELFLRALSASELCLSFRFLLMGTQCCLKVLYASFRTIGRHTGAPISAAPPPPFISYLCKSEPRQKEKSSCNRWSSLAVYSYNGRSVCTPSPPHWVGQSYWNLGWTLSHLQWLLVCFSERFVMNPIFSITCKCDVTFTFYVCFTCHVRHTSVCNLKVTKICICDDFVDSPLNT